MSFMEYWQGRVTLRQESNVYRILSEWVRSLRHEGHVKLRNSLRTHGPLAERVCDALIISYDMALLRRVGGDHA